MAIKNFTTSIDSYKTISEIQQILARRGAQQIMIKNDQEGNPVSISFVALWGLQPIAYTLPCNFEGVKRAMSNDKKVSRSMCTNEQAPAWSLPQIFLPYAVTKTGHTVYEMMESKKEMLQLNQ